MLSPRWKKLLGDLRGSSGRLAMMVAALAVGIFGVATILGAYTILTREISRNYLATHPASALLEVDARDDALLAAVRRRPGIDVAEAGATLLARVEVAPGASLPLLLFVVPDFDAMRLNTVKPEAGAWPPPTGTVLLERTALELTRRQIGGTLPLRTADGARRTLRISGLVHDAGLAPAWQEQTVYGYVTPATLALLGESGLTHLLKIGVGEAGFDRGRIESVATGLAQWLTARGAAPGEIRIPPPGRHPHQTQMSAILTMLLIFSGLALLLSAVLGATMIGALLAQQVRQIGVMKAVGARSWQIARLYLALVALVGVAALALGLPAGAAAGRGFARAIAGLLNFTLYSEAIPPWLYLAQVLAGLLLPLALALVPIRRATGSTAWRAMHDFGVGRRQFGAGRFEALLGKVRGVDRTLVLAIRNSFRRRGRLALTLGLLAAAGAMFMTSLNVKAAWERNLADAAAQRHYDLELRLSAPVEEGGVLALVAAVPGVLKVEPWNVLAASAARADGLEISPTYPDGGHGSFTLRSVPPGSALIGLTLLSGRWLAAGDTDAVVLNHMGQAAFPRARVGDTIALRVGAGLASLRVVGIAREIITPAAAYVAPQGFARATGLGGRVNALRVVMAAHRPGDIATVTARIGRALEQAGVQTKVELSETRLDGALAGHVYILIVALIAMSLLMASVGALGLMSAMATSVIERTREFGVMRAVGGRSGAILRNVIGEGVFIGLMSWCVAVVLALPLSAAVGSLLGTLAFRSPLPLCISAGALAIWLLLVLLVALAASAGPAWTASRLTVRETLAYI